MLDAIGDIAGGASTRRLPLDFSDPNFKTNKFAATAWITGFLGGVFLAIPLAIFALFRTPKEDRNSRDLAIGALISSFGWILVAALLLLTR
ncbi:hypothetical protein [Nocardia bhagyanarayanae]|uniref:DUF4190 domain-containing protein n=1 Tax=Nocardia bhagyanarayanae TaxID=1215925 RepID=A0A543F6A5_9NOCA|nr:hypothetical protein [Nocardia bhagyanarayanae]TQM29364.1 hypothetical protein FB390_0961 [Nocardia bhagyanarayanae]